MQKLNSKNKRGLIFFVREESNSNVKKFHNKKTYDLFNQRIQNVIKETQGSIEFDIILCSNKIGIIESNIFIKQTGKKYGERFNNAIKDSFAAGYYELVIIGNDTPDISADQIIKSFENVSQKIIVGPSPDGGFYLLGLSKNNYKNEINVRWKTHHTLNDLINHFDRKNIQLLIWLKDIDSETDLKNWFFIKSKISHVFENILSGKYRQLNREILRINLTQIEQNIFRIQTQKAPPLVQPN